MKATEYASRSSARRAARAAGLDPDKVTETPKGRFVLPAPAPTNGSGKPTPAGMIDEGIPEFLRVANRVPLTPEQEKRLEAVTKEAREEERRGGHNKPKSVTWEEWDAFQAAEKEKKRAASLERVAALKAKHPPKPKRLPKPKREDAFTPDQIISVLVKENPCRPGTAAHTVFALYRDGMTVAEFNNAAVAQKACPGRLRPIDYLIYDSRKGRIAIGTVKIERPTPKPETARGELLTKLVKATAKKPATKQRKGKR